MFQAASAERSIVPLETGNRWRSTFRLCEVSLVRFRFSRARHRLRACTKTSVVPRERAKARSRSDLVPSDGTYAIRPEWADLTKGYRLNVILACVCVKEKKQIVLS